MEIGKKIFSIPLIFLLSFLFDFGFCGKCVYKVVAPHGVNVRSCAQQSNSICPRQFAMANGDTAYSLSTSTTEDDFYIWRNVEYIGSTQPEYFGLSGWSVEVQKSPYEVWMEYVDGDCNFEEHLGIGLGVSIAAVLLIVGGVLAFYCYLKKKKIRIASRQSEIKELPLSPPRPPSNYEQFDSGTPQSSKQTIEGKGSAEKTSWKLAKPSMEGEQWEIDYNEIKFANEIGRGAYGVVFKATYRFQTVAVKRMLLLDEKQRIDFEQEAALLKTIRPHQNVVQVLGVVTKETEKLCIVTEFCSGGNLVDYLQQAALSNEKIIRFAKQAAAGMGHLAKEAIVHRDLAARNLLLMNDYNTLKITDFGLARIVDGEGTENAKKTNAMVGPIRWMAPESLRNKIYSTKSDVYSYGCVLIELITRDVPFGHITQAFDVAMAVVKDGATPPIPANTPPPLVDLIKTCFQDAQHRPSFQEINEYLERAAP